MGQDAVCIWAAGATLGEGALWLAEEQALYWVDILQPRILRWDPTTGAQAEWPMPEPIGFIAPRRRGGLVAGLRSGFHLVDLPEGRVTPIGNPEPDRPGNRFNDGKVDPMGRLWAGTVEFGCTEPTGAFYRLDPDHRWHRMDDGYIVTNGPAFSPDGRILYEADSDRRVIHAYDLDLASGDVSNRRPFVLFAEDDGVPDGMTIDREGHLWVAHWGGSRVSRFRPDGTLDRAVAIPAPHVTSCAFGDPGLTTLYVTTARAGMSEAALRQHPLSGGLFEIKDAGRGLPGSHFAG
ncbi:SMP-30/gluconolactonase/LRE family protein [Inquilinus sp. NPDC058860]|uniref:SMP-30/gluconolactonase/LRE family protein n=1 Tax=Inquilinus sp. NPDC058860 TaxID=3346652 RepID=UPI0036C75C9C